MKRLTYIYFVIIIGLLGFASCEREQLTKDDTGGQQIDTRAEGKVNLSSLKVAVETATGSQTRAINTADFIVRIFDVDNSGKLVKEWKYSEMPEIFALKVGNYMVAAYSHDEVPAAFERPYYYGKQDFSIVADDVTDIDILKCFLHSIMVTIEYDEKLQELLGEDAVSTVSVGTASLNFHKDETRAGYFQALTENSNILNARLSGTVEGATVNYEQGFSGVKAGEHRVIRYTLKEVDEGGNGDGGSAGITIKVDATCEIVDEDVTVDPGHEEEVPDFPNEGGGEKPEEPEDPEPPVGEDAPVITGANFNGASFDIDKTQNLPEACTLIVNIAAPKGIQHLKVAISSSNAEFDGIGAELAEFDLAHSATMLPDTKAMLGELGLPMDEKVLNQPQLDFDISGFTGMLLGFSGVHTFKITVTDNAGNTLSKSLKIEVGN